MAYDFDRVIDRREFESAKWHHYDEDVLPLWVADTDFQVPGSVIRALRERVDHGIFGYPNEPPDLRHVILERLQRLYDWQVAPEALIFVPGVVTGFNLTCHALANPGDGVMVQTPVYPPMLSVQSRFGLTRDEMELTQGPGGYYTVDYATFEATITQRTRIFLLCNPHNPVGRVFTREELERMAEICLRHDMLICSDEIHCDLLFSGSRHIPIATLSPEVRARTVTLMAPSKTYNIAGLDCSYMIVENEELRARIKATRAGIVPGVNLMGHVAALAAYRDGQEWLAEAMRYMERNRDYLHAYVASELPGIQMGRPEGTYLAWLDCRQADIPGNPATFFLEQARVGLNDGEDFGRGGPGFVRLNFGCPRSTLEQALERMKKALAERPAPTAARRR